jgi:Paf1
VRDYETVKVEQEVPNEFLLVIHDGDDEEDVFETMERPKKEKGAYYKNIERKMLLKKRRANVSVQCRCWHGSRLTVIRHTRTNMKISGR